MGKKQRKYFMFLWHNCRLQTLWTGKVYSDTSHTPDTRGVWWWYDWQKYYPAFICPYSKQYIKFV